jgi:hypothetical protein
LLNGFEVTRLFRQHSSGDFWYNHPNSAGELTGEPFPLLGSAYIIIQMIKHEFSLFALKSTVHLLQVNYEERKF